MVSASKEEWRALGLQSGGCLLLSGNVAVWKTVGGYWGAAAENAPLMHTWSLGVEEQFYLFYPLVLIPLLRGHRNGLRAILLLGSAAGFGLFAWASRAHPIGAFYLLPTRAWELLVGCATAICADRFFGKSRTANCLSAVGLGLVVATYVIRLRWFGGMGSPALICVLGTVLLLIGGGANAGVSRGLLGNAAAVYVGRASYSLYLWHWPAFVYAGWLGFAAHSPIALLVFISTALACFHGVEQPCRRMQDKRRLLLISGGAFLLLLSVGTMVMVGKIPSRLSQVSLLDNSLHAGGGFEAAGKIDAGGIIRPYGGANPEIVVVGSSHARMHSVAIDQIGRELGKTVAFLGVSDGGILEPSKEQLRKQRLSWIHRWRPQLVIMAGRWTQELNRSKDAEEFYSVLHATSADILKSANTLLVLGQVPQLPVRDLSHSIAVGMNRAARPPEFEPGDDWKIQNERLAREIGAIEGARFLDFSGVLLNGGGRVIYHANSVRLYRDGHHINDAGSAFLRPVLAPVIDELLKARP